MNYDQTLDFLFNRVQSFHNQGATAYKPGLAKALKLSAAFGNPHLSFPSIHVGGTNGKGSTTHTLASVLMEAGLKVGLYTSPHLVDFRERIRIDGQPIGKEEVVDFVDRFINMNLTDTDPSFFELTTIMAFEHFARHHVDIAVIEVGLGGRLDTTNIITPLLSVITNISYDHTALLGNTLTEIAKEKAGIIKPGIPAVIGRRNPETDPVFSSIHDKVSFAPDLPTFDSFDREENLIIYRNTPWGDLASPLVGDCQTENMQTVLVALNVLEQTGFVSLNDATVATGIKNVCRNTYLTGRWTLVREKPKVITDTAHNVDGWKHIAPMLKRHLPHPLFIVLGFVNDKDYKKILELLPPEARYFFVAPSVHRAAPADVVARCAHSVGLAGNVYGDVVSGYEAALREAAKYEDALIYVGGSTFVVADLLAALP